MALSPGTRLGHDDVTALKILPNACAAYPDRLARFTREGQILARINHPNIVAIDGMESACAKALVSCPTIPFSYSLARRPAGQARRGSKLEHL